MSGNLTLLPGFPLPTLQHLGASQPTDVDAKAVAAEWLGKFAAAAEASDAEGVAKLFMSECYWRDMLALTWDFRTFTGIDNIRTFLVDRLPISQLKSFKIRDEYLSLQQPFPDLVWIMFLFDFEADGSWKANTILTNLEDLQGFPERIGANRSTEANHGLWASQRQAEMTFKDKEPTALVIGGGQGGLEIAARLKVLDISTLIVEKNSRIGDNWRNRYQALCLHDPVYADHLPYMPFPANWPVYAPSAKLANWLEFYAETMELNVWLSSEVTKATQNADNTWAVTVRFSDGKERHFKSVNHIIFAAGIAGGDVNMPTYPGTEKFKGEIIHSAQYKTPAPHIGKKVVVVGACTSAHDIASDYHLHGVDVTMYQRSSTYVMSTKSGWDVFFAGLYAENALPTEIADRVNASLPNSFLYHGFVQRAVGYVAQLDKALLDGLHERGFRTNMGIDGTGFTMLAFQKAAGYYLDVGASQMIIDGKIKLKNDSLLQKFTETGLKFEDGSEVPADVVVYATGYGDARGIIRKICGEEVASKCSQVWGMNAEGELQGTFKDMRVPGLWYCLGNLSLDRFHSKHLALQIKAIEEKKFGTRYSLRA
ncbi:hypothetical protein D9757_000853 [Collybiopsis confluens]|uniref:Flavin-containing monooxygenase n=1 Tax=Collybiopsis confluens TaxID=2823264 RepID=A0A8H5MGJ7_9AGAR|nr:hypothetical protein D9757_000853 [Collybiopsis confluens]